MNIYGKSDIGLKRSSNQDCFDIGIVNENMVWAVVCDGMGGANGGDIASALAAKHIKEDMIENFIENISEDSIENILKNAVNKANYKIYNMAQNDIELIGMGTTVVLAAVFNSKIHIAHVGDSRAYLIKDGKVKQLTIDHSMVQKMIDDGEITREQAKSHPNKNIITRALGIAKNVDIDYLISPIDEKSTILVCTDGLTNHLEANDILNCSERKNCETFVDELISIANSRGGNDNITVVVIRE